MPKIFMVSLGCAKNLVDAETMLGETLDDDFQLELDPTAADVVLVNTCGFIEEARQEAREVIAEFLEIKLNADHPVKVVAMGCWAERSPEDMLAEFPDLDAVWGLAVPSSLQDAIRNLDRHAGVFCRGASSQPREGARLVTTLPSFAYLRISDGCDNRCHYCAIPLIRGALRSRQPDAILDEAKSLEDQGVRELVVISQDTTAYAHDLKIAGLNLASLLERLLAVVAVPRIRLLYAHPAHLDEPVMDMLLSETRLCHYLDLPIQHISDRMLEAMGRGYGRDRVMDVLNRLRGRVTLRTTLLSGFPGETDEDFREALDLVKAGYFQHLGAFAYSPEKDTPAYVLPDQVPNEVAARRRDALMDAQSRIAFAWLDSRIGKTEGIVIDSRLDREWLLGRSIHEAPDADGRIYVRKSKSAPGAMIDACIKSREGYDLLAEGVAPGKAGRRRK